MWISLKAWVAKENNFILQYRTCSVNPVGDTSNDYITLLLTKVQFLCLSMHNLHQCYTEGGSLQPICIHASQRNGTVNSQRSLDFYLPVKDTRQSKLPLAHIIEDAVSNQVGCGEQCWLEQFTHAALWCRKLPIQLLLNADNRSAERSLTPEAVNITKKYLMLPQWANVR